jgi:cytochrome c-type biogenesis protein CcmF
MRGRLDHDWLRLARRWTLGPWVLLTLGLLAGAWWSYAVLGWGGYWGWDPVENVALLPWLTATAFLHSAMVGRRGGRLLGWNVVLISASFALTIFATLVTRSGILDSVHAFTRSAIGPLFVGLLGAVLAGTVGLLALRLPETGDRATLGTRGRAFLLNNLLLAVVAATVLFGTVFPLLAEAFADTRLSVGAPYFERVFGPLAAGLLILVGIGPSLPWSDWSPAARRSLVPGALAAAGTAALLALLGSEAAAIAGSAAGVFALVQSMTLLGQRLPLALLRSRTDATSRLSSTRAVGGLLSHAGVGLLALAVVASATGTREAVVTLAPGDSAKVLGQTVWYSGSEQRPGPNRTVVLARLRVGDDADGATDLTPTLSVFNTSTQAIAGPAIVPGLVDDLYVTLLDLDTATDIATVRIGTHPFVSWIWPAGLLVALGGLLALAGLPFGRPVRAGRSAVSRPATALKPEAGLDVVGP